MCGPRSNRVARLPHSPCAGELANATLERGCALASVGLDFSRLPQSKRAVLSPGQYPGGVHKNTPQRIRIALGVIIQGDKVCAFRVCSEK